MSEKELDETVRPKPAALAWISLAARLILGGAILLAGLLKIGDVLQSVASGELPGTVAAVRAYALPLPGWFSALVGYAMPFAEILLGAVIMAGLFTRWTALLGGLMMVVYIALIASAWYRGLSIDCGCFSPGGLLAPGEKTKYLEDILRDLGFLACAIWLVRWPDSPLSLDKWVAGPENTEV